MVVKERRKITITQNRGYVKWRIWQSQAIRNGVFRLIAESNFLSLMFRGFAKLKPLRRPIFVTAVNRSGSTMFTNYLSQSRDIVNWSEANELWDPLGFPWDNGEHPRPFWAMNPQAHVDIIPKELGDGYFKKVAGICSMHGAARSGLFGNFRFVNKCPRNALRVPLLDSLFPDACFVGLFRNPFAVIRSWSQHIIPQIEARANSSVSRRGTRIVKYTVDGVDYNRLELLDVISHSYNYIATQQLAALDSLPGNRVFFLRYEDFVNQPREIIARIDAKFGVTFESREWDQLPNLKSRNFKYKNKLRDSELHLIHTNCASIFDRFGYNVEPIVGSTTH